MESDFISNLNWNIAESRQFCDKFISCGVEMDYEEESEVIDKFSETIVSKVIKDVFVGLQEELSTKSNNQENISDQQQEVRLFWKFCTFAENIWLWVINGYFHLRFLLKPSSHQKLLKTF